MLVVNVCDIDINIDVMLIWFSRKWGVCGVDENNFRPVRADKDNVSMSAREPASN